MTSSYVGSASDSTLRRSSVRQVAAPPASPPVAKATLGATSLVTGVLEKIETAVKIVPIKRVKRASPGRGLSPVCGIASGCWNPDSSGADFHGQDCCQDLDSESVKSALSGEFRTSN